MQNDDVVRLLGTVRSKRVLELGCGTGDTAIAFTREGATVIGIDESPALVADARAAAEAAEVKLELRAGDLADLAFLRADSMDMACSLGALAHVEDLDRLFRQVHRVLRPGAPFAFSLPHPFTLGIESEVTPEGALPLGSTRVVRSYFDPSPVDVGSAEAPDVVHRHALGDVFAGLVRAGFRVDTLLEPEPARTGSAAPLLPTTVVWKARKEGS
jgi:SAM-dependent methyltransferase